MAVIRGCKGKVKLKLVGATGATALLGELTNWAFNETAERIDASAMGDCSKKFEAGAQETTGSLDCNLDPADARQLLLTCGSQAVLEIYPDGDTTGKKYYKTPAAGATIVSRNPAGGGVDGIASVSFGFAVNGAMTTTTVP